MKVMLIARPALNDRLRNSPRSIGETLFISAKTAGVHVSNILMKLGVTSRTEAAAVAHRLGLDT
jgi:DNA-binding NarL/FixJ family response regulator